MRHRDESSGGATAAPTPELRTLFGTVLLCAALIGWLGCGTDDLVFPGQIADTPTPQFTTTSTPVATATP